MRIADQILAKLHAGPHSAAELARVLDVKIKAVLNATQGLKLRGDIVALGTRGSYTYALSESAPQITASTPARKRSTKPAAEVEPDTPADPDAPEIFVGRFSCGDVQIGVGEEALRISFDAAREVHALLTAICEGPE
jgi:phage repressor protein C with HTH and peptisase S24 domain